MDPLGAGALPGERGVEWIAVRRLAPGLALDEADGDTAGDVDGGQELQAGVGHAPNGTERAQRDARRSKSRTTSSGHARALATSAPIRHGHDGWSSQ